MTSPASRRHGAALLLAVLLTAVLAACSSSIDTDKVDKNFTKKYESEDVGSKVKSVKCPDSPEAKKGVTFTCDFALETGEKGEFTVKVKNSDGDITYSVTKQARNVISPEKTESLIEADAKKQSGLDATVTCPAAIAGAPDATTKCAVELSDGSKGEVTVTPTDQNGGIGWEYTTPPR